MTENGFEKITKKTANPVNRIGEMVCQETRELFSRSMRSSENGIF